MNNNPDAQFEYMKETYGVDLTEELIEILVKQVNALSQEWGDPDKLTTDALIHSAHKIKSSARNVGAFQLGDTLHNIEKSPELGAVKEKLAIINRELTQFTDSFKKWKNKEA